MCFERNLGTCRSWNRLFGHTPTSFNCQAGSTECCRICRTIAPVAMILKGSYEHPVSCLMCNDMQSPKSAREQFHRSSKLLRCCSQWPQIMCGCIVLYRCLWLHSCFGHASDDLVQEEIKENTRSVFHYVTSQAHSESRNRTKV